MDARQTGQILSDVGSSLTDPNYQSKYDGDFWIGDYEVSLLEEGGQPNGVGKIEPNDAREWFTEERESHHRTVITVYGPWRAGAREEIQRRRNNWAALQAIAAAEEEEKILARAAEITEARRKAGLALRAALENDEATREARRMEAMDQQEAELAARLDAEEAR